jgi:YesN/AraC family two-component response regulator
MPRLTLGQAFLCQKKGCSTVRILVADDHETIRKGVRSILSARKSIEVSEAATGKEAADKARETKPDLLILDIHMPIMGGLETAREIRILAERSDSFFTMHSPRPGG